MSRVGGSPGGRPGAVWNAGADPAIRRRTRCGGGLGAGRRRQLQLEARSLTGHGPGHGAPGPRRTGAPATAAGPRLKTS